MNIKKLLALLLAAVMMLALVACGDDPAPTPDPDPDPNPVETPDGDKEPQSVLTMYTFMDTAPDLVGTSWSFIGGCVDGVMMTEDQVAAALSQLDDYYISSLMMRPPLPCMRAPTPRRQAPIPLLTNPP